MKFNTYSILLSTASALKCYSNGKGGPGAPAPFKYEQDQKDATNCVHQVIGTDDYYTGLSDAQLETVIASGATTPKGVAYGVFSCKTDYCNDPAVPVVTKLGTGPAAWTSPTSGATSPATQSTQLPSSSVSHFYVLSIVGAMIIPFM